MLCQSSIVGKHCTYAVGTKYQKKKKNRQHPSPLSLVREFFFNYNYMYIMVGEQYRTRFSGFGFSGNVDRKRRR